MTLYAVKASVLSTVERVLGPDQKTQRLICWVLQGITGLCGVASLIVVLVSCDGAHLLTGQRNEKCGGQVGHDFVRLQRETMLIAASDAALDCDHHSGCYQRSVHLRCLLLLHLKPADAKATEGDRHSAVGL